MSDSKNEKTLAFVMTQESALEFYRRCMALGADTEEARQLILWQMADEGLIDNVVESSLSEEDYLKHVQENFNVVDMRGEFNDRSPEN